MGFGNIVKFTQVTLSLVPEVLDAIDVFLPAVNNLHG
jgi:hypothetical protein